MANDTKQGRYNDPAGGTASDIGPQFNTSYYHKMALEEMAKETYFGQLADTTSMPKNYGKTIKKFHYMPLLDDRNLNDQGIDAAGAVIVKGKWSAYNAAGVLQGSAYANRAAALVAAGARGKVFENSGNLYGSSKDIGLITAKIPALSETGGRVNRVGFTRIELQASIEKLGFFYEYTQDSLDFDTDAELYQHISRENILGANEIVEDLLQIDLLNGAGVHRYGGEASSKLTVTGEGANPSVIVYDDLMRLSIDLDNNRCPKRTKVITGSRMVDTKVVNAGRFLYHGSEMTPTLVKMVDPFGNQAFVGVEHYAHAGTVDQINFINGEIGKIDQFRLIQVPEMASWQGAGAAATGANLGYRETDGFYDVYPLLCVGAESFTTVGFQTDGKEVKFKILNKKPGAETADFHDPFGETGFSSIKWWYGTLIQRSERIAVAYSVAEI